MKGHQTNVTRLGIAISNDTQDREVGLDADGDVFEDHDWPRRLTVLGGEVWIIAEPSVPLTLTARRH